MKLLKTLLLVGIVVSTVSCNKDEATPDRTKLLTQKEWTFNTVSGYDIITNAFYSALLNGSTYKFNSDGTYDATALTIPFDGEWVFNSDETVIALDPTSVDKEDWTIVTLDANTLTVTAEDVDATTGTYTLTFN